MMPLTMLNTGEPSTIKKVGGKEETRRFLENLGFVPGGEVTVVSEIDGNMIVNIKDSRVAIGKDDEDVERSSLRQYRKGQKTDWRGPG